MSAEEDAEKSGKKLGSVIVLCLAIVGALGYLLMSWLGPQNSAGPSAVNLNSTTTGAGGETPESPRYRELLKADNDQGAAAAKRNQTSFIASLPMGLDSQKPPAAPETPPAPDTEQPASSPPQASGDARAADEKRQARLQQLLARIRARQSGAPPVVAAALWGGPAQQGQRRPPGGVETVGGNGGSRSPSPQSQRPVMIIPALTRAPATLDTAINSDNPDSQVTVTLQAGPWKGAVLYSPGVKLAGNGVQIHFTQMDWQGLPLKVNAWAQRESDLQSSVASDVSHHWMTQIVLPSVFSGTGQLGKLYRDANTQVVQGTFGNVTSRVGTPNGAAVAGVMLGGTAERASDVLTKALGDVPFKQVRVDQGEVISVLFVDAVTTSGSTTDTLSTPTVSPVSGNTPAPALRPAEGVKPYDAQRRLQSISETRRAQMRERYPWQEEP